MFMGAFMFLGMYLSHFLFGVDLVSNPSLLNEMNTNPQVLRAMQLSQSLASIGGFMIAAILFPRSFGEGRLTFLKANQPAKPIFWLMAFALYIAATPLIAWTASINEAITFPASFAELEAKLRASENAAGEMTKAFLSNANGNTIFITLIVTAVIPAIAEEFLFRGALLQLFMYCFRSRHFAVWASAIIFSAIHGQFFGFIPRTLLGVCMGYLVMGSGSLWTAVLFHLINNTLVTFNGYYHWEESGYQIFREDFAFPIYVNLISLAATVALIYALVLQWKKRVFPNGE